MGEQILRTRLCQAGVRTPVTVLKGRHRGKIGSIAGSLESRAARGVTRTVVQVGGDFELVPTSWLEPRLQLELPLAQMTTPPV